MKEQPIKPRLKITDEVLQTALQLVEEGTGGVCLQCGEVDRYVEPDEKEKCACGGIVLGYERIILKAV